MSASAPAVSDPQPRLVGNLTADPVLKQLDDDRRVCNLRVAVNDQKGQPPLFIDVATFGAQADACARYLTKGRAVAVTGRLVYRERTTTAPAAAATTSSGASSSAASPTSPPPRPRTPPRRSRPSDQRPAPAARWRRRHPLFNPDQLVDLLNKATTRPRLPSQKPLRPNSK